LPHTHTHTYTKSSEDRAEEIEISKRKVADLKKEEEENLQKNLTKFLFADALHMLR
jgi:hypothetical protein